MSTNTKDNKAIKANFQKAKVLVIEDNNDHWELMLRAIQHRLPEVTAVRAATSAQTMAYLNEWSLEEWEVPKLILLDLYMPKREDGWALLSKLRDLSMPTNQVPIVVLTHSNNPLDVSEAYERGSSSYLVKPITFDDWLQLFQELRVYWWETVTLPPLQLSL